jgi:uncharacterized damage-inducible protein DinB
VPPELSIFLVAHKHFMDTSKQISKHLKEVFFGGNWTSVNLKDTLKDVSWEQAVRSIYTLNSIAKLTFHINYYVATILKVLRGGPLDAHDKYSFDLPPITSEGDWQKLKDKAFNETEQLISLVEQLPYDKLDNYFVEEKYGTYYRNLHGLIEHTHYHLGQIAVIKKISPV